MRKSDIEKVGRLRDGEVTEGDLPEPAVDDEYERLVRLGDLDRRVADYWRQRRHRVDWRPVPAPLDRAIVDEAQRLGRVRKYKIAKRLGVDPSTVYRHVDALLATERIVGAVARALLGDEPWDATHGQARELSRELAEAAFRPLPPRPDELRRHAADLRAQAAWRRSKGWNGDEAERLAAEFEEGAEAPWPPPPPPGFDSSIVDLLRETYLETGSVPFMQAVTEVRPAGEWLRRFLAKFDHGPTGASIREHYRARTPPRCPICGRFISKRAKTCGPRCRKRAQRLRNKGLA